MVHPMIRHPFYAGFQDEGGEGGTERRTTPRLTPLFVSLAHFEMYIDCDEQQRLVTVTQVLSVIMIVVMTIEDAPT